MSSEDLIRYDMRRREPVLKSKDFVTPELNFLNLVEQSLFEVLFKVLFRSSYIHCW